MPRRVVEVTPRTWIRAGLMAVILLVAVASSMGSGPSAATAQSPAGHCDATLGCDATPATGPTLGRSGSAPCIRSAACGGGAALVGTAMVLVAVVATSRPVALRRPFSWSLVGTDDVAPEHLHPSRLFRPPQGA